MKYCRYSKAWIPHAVIIFECKRLICESIENVGMQDRLRMREIRLQEHDTLNGWGKAKSIDCIQHQAAPEGMRDEYRRFLVDHTLMEIALRHLRCRKGFFIPV